MFLLKGDHQHKKTSVVINIQVILYFELLACFSYEKTLLIYDDINYYDEASGQVKSYI